MVGLFYIYLPMSWQIPTQIEQDIIAGKAKYQTFQTGNGGQSILPVPPNSYAVIFGYDFSPAGGGIQVLQTPAAQIELTNNALRFFETQQISFYTGSDFYPFIHHVNTQISGYGIGVEQRNISNIDTTPLSRQVYITSTNDVTITHGLILNATRVTENAIPVTSRTPGTLTYGGTAIANQTQTDYGPAGTPLQFMQPSPKDFADFGFGLLPGNADGQAFATPDLTNGLKPASLQLKDIGGIDFMNAAAANYYLCLHYAIYSKTIPEQRG